MGTINANNAPTQVTPLSGVTSFLLSCFCSFFLFLVGGGGGLHSHFEWLFQNNLKGRHYSLGTHTQLTPEGTNPNTRLSSVEYATHFTGSHSLLTSNSSTLSFWGAVAFGTKAQKENVKRLGHSGNSSEVPRSQNNVKNSQIAKSKRHPSLWYPVLCSTCLLWDSLKRRWARPVILHCVCLVFECSSCLFHSDPTSPQRLRAFGSHSWGWRQEERQRTYSLHLGSMGSGLLWRPEPSTQWIYISTLEKKKKGKKKQASLPWADTMVINSLRWAFYFHGVYTQ